MGQKSTNTMASRGREVARRRVCAAAWLLMIVLVCASQTGCVERRFTIRSNPPGAVVYVDDYEIGTTPVSHDFIYYGTRKIRLVKDGYETLTVKQPVPTPWYEYPPLDFISDNFIPGKIHDDRVLDYQLQPQIMVPTNELLGRADNLRRGSRAPQAPLPSLPQPETVPPAGTYPLPAPPSATAPRPFSSPGY